MSDDEDEDEFNNEEAEYSGFEEGDGTGVNKESDNYEDDDYENDLWLINNIYYTQLYASPALDRQLGLMLPRSFRALMGLCPL